MIKRSVCLLLVLLFIGANSLQAAKGYRAEYRKLKSDQAEIDFSVSDYQIKEIRIEGTSYSRIVFSGKTTLSKQGYAELPFVNANIQLPPDKNVSIEIIEAKYQDIQLNSPLLPSRGEINRSQNLDLIPYAIAPESVVDEWYPAKSVTMSKPFIFRESRGVNIYAYPFAYNAQTQTLRVYSSLKVKLTEDTSLPTNQLKTKLEKVAPVMQDIYQSVFLNYNSDSRFPHQVDEDGEILVLHTARDAAAIEPYVLWKREKGFKITTQEVAVGTNVKSIIQSAYNVNPNLLYVQLVGDWADIKSDFITFPVLGSGATDPMLGCVSGDDLYPELIIGRFSGNNPEQISVQVDKTINYEKNPDLDPATNSWYKRGLGIGSAEGDIAGDDSEIDWEHIDIIKNYKLLPATYSNISDAYRSAPVTSVSNPVNDGVGIINYCGHGAPALWFTSNFSNNNVNSSTNGNKLPFIISVACFNGAFHLPVDCFAEAWLKKENGGAVATIMNTIGHPWAPPMRGQDYMNDILTGGYNYAINPGYGTNTSASDTRTTFGSVTLNGTVLMLAEDVDEVNTQNTIQTWTIFGDASLQLRTDLPKPITISNTSFLAGKAYTTRITSGGYPLANARVTIAQNGNYFSCRSGSNGEVVIPEAVNLTCGNAKLTVTAFNCESKSLTVQVIDSSDPYLILDDYSVSQNGSGWHAIYGKTIKVNLKLKNCGSNASNNIHITAKSNSPYIHSITDSTENVVALSGNSSTDLFNALTLNLKNKIKDQCPMPITLTITDSSTKKSCTALLTLYADAPNLLFSASSVGTLMPGSNNKLVYKLKNSGHASINQLNAVLTQSTSWPVTISNPVLNSNLLAAGDSVNLGFDAQFSSTIPLNSAALLNLHLNAAADIDTTFISRLMIGLTTEIFLESFEADWTPAGWNNTGWIQSCFGGVNGTKCAKTNLGTPLTKTLVTKSINLSSSFNDTLSFWWKDQDFSKAAGCDTTFCEVSADGNNWVSIGYLSPLTPQMDYNLFTYPIPAEYQTADFKIRWRDKINNVGSGYGTGLDNISIRGYVTETAIDNNSRQLPATTLMQNYPNPFNPETTIRFFNKDAGLVKLFIYNLKGETVATLVNGELNQGMHSFNFKATGLASGVYVYKLQTGNQSIVKSMLLLK